MTFFPITLILLHGIRFLGSIREILSTEYGDRQTIGVGQILNFEIAPSGTDIDRRRDFRAARENRFSFY